jgi:hypothetical protein
MRFKLDENLPYRAPLARSPRPAADQSPGPHYHRLKRRVVSALLS